MLRGKTKWLLGLILLIVIVAAGYAFYLYQQGGTEHYRPPEKKAESPREQVLGDMKALSQTVEAYYAKNLRYPERLEQLKPDFLGELPAEPGTKKAFVYESDTQERYRIAVSDPSRYGLTELFLENGEVVQK